MSNTNSTDPAQEKERMEQKMRIQRQLAFASGIFQGNITVRTLMESISEGVVVIDSSGTILLVNTPAEQLFGYTKQDLIGKPHAILIPERYHKVHKEHEAHYFEAPRRRPMGQLLDLYGCRQDGSEFPLEISLGFIETINGVLVLAFVNDITLRKQYESTLKESEALFRVIFDQASQLMGLIKPDGTLIKINRTAAEFIKTSESEVIGKLFWETPWWTHSPEEQEKLKEAIKAAACGEFVRFETTHRTPAGDLVWVDFSLKPVKDDLGQVTLFCRKGATSPSTSG